MVRDEKVIERAKTYAAAQKGGLSRSRGLPANYVALSDGGMRHNAGEWLVGTKP